MLAISVAATRSYLHAFPQCIRSIATAAAHLEKANFIFVTDTSDEAAKAAEFLETALPPNWKVTTIRIDGMEEDSKSYEVGPQLRIARLQGAAFDFARSKLKASQFWCVESDNIVPANALRVLQWTLAMPDAAGNGYYDVAAATYYNGLFLGGFGTPRSPINQDFLPHERKLPKRLQNAMKACEQRLKDGQPLTLENYTNYPECYPSYVSACEKISAKERKRMERLVKRVAKCPPDGNIWEVTAKHGWKRRGWMDFAYPGIGEGAIVPSDWCGLGCTLLSGRALALADFQGYDGGGTQDLFLCWKRWHPAGLRIACVPHVVCDHVKREGDKITHHIGYHEQDPAYRGHLRVRSQPFVSI